VDATHPGLTREVLGQQAYRVVANATHPLVQPGARPDLAALAAAGWVLGTGLGEIEQAWRATFTRAGLPPPAPLLTTSSLEFCRNVLRSSQLLSVLPLQLVETELDRGEFALVELPAFCWKRPLALYLPHGALPPPVLMESLQRAVARELRLSGAARAGQVRR
jgi:DNA-binding transcriptional LysR family regulator